MRCPFSTRALASTARSVPASGVRRLPHGRDPAFRPGAAAYANRMVTNEAAALPDGKVVYSPMCREDGGILDDLLVYALGAGTLLVVNAANCRQGTRVGARHAPDGVTVADENATTAQLAVQGPKAEEVVARLYATARDAGFLEGSRPAPAKSGPWSPAPATRGRTDSRSTSAPPARCRCGTGSSRREPRRHRAIGLGARDTLRLEMGYCLYGNDIDETTNPIEAGPGGRCAWRRDLVQRPRGDRARTQRGPRRKLLGLLLEEDRFHDTDPRWSGRAAARDRHERLDGDFPRTPSRDGRTSKGTGRPGREVDVMVRGQATPPSMSSARCTGRAPCAAQTQETRMKVPADLRYTKEHDWIPGKGSEAEVGITEYAQGERGNVIFVELPAGIEGDPAEALGTIDAVKTVSDLFVLPGSRRDHGRQRDAPAESGRS